MSEEEQSLSVETSYRPLAGQLFGRTRLQPAWTFG